MGMLKIIKQGLRHVAGYISGEEVGIRMNSNTFSTNETNKPY